MFCDLYMYKNNLEVLFLNFCKWIKKLILTLFVHWNVCKYSDLILIPNYPALLLFNVLVNTTPRSPRPQPDKDQSSSALTSCCWSHGCSPVFSHSSQSSISPLLLPYAIIKPEQHLEEPLSSSAIHLNSPQSCNPDWRPHFYLEASGKQVSIASFYVS